MRFQRQIETVIAVFNQVHSHFERGESVDQTLNRIFRTHRKYGSRDRRLIGNAIFGLYRWYGWLNPWVAENPSQALLCGYLLDDNEISHLIMHWCGSLGLSKEWILSWECPESQTIPKKRNHLIAVGLQPEMEDLNPSMLSIQLTESQINAFQTRSPLSIRVLPSAMVELECFLREKGVTYRDVPKLPNAVLIDSALNLKESEAYRRGLLEVQDLSSQLIGMICAPKAGENWWDACAGSGGKALHLAALMEDEGLILATEIRESSFRELNRRIQKGRWRSIAALQKDCRSMDQKVMFDGVLIDAPCSCSGTWRRAPDLRWTFSQEQVAHLVAVQQDLLDQVSRAVKIGGILLYATCSIIPEENEQAIKGFLEKHANFSLQPFQHPLKEETCAGSTLLMPPEVDGNGMFVAKMVRNY